MVTLSEIKAHLERKAPNTRLNLVDGDFGHVSGAAVENWVQEAMTDLPHTRTDKPHDLLNRLHASHVERGIPHIEAMDYLWWPRILLSGKPKKNGNYANSQCAGADLVTYDMGSFPAGMNDARLINVKSHSLDRKGRAPNIQSALRLLRFFASILDHPERRLFLQKMSCWVLSVSHKKGCIIEIHAKDLFLLDVSQIPIINFDAALQMQWHVKDMVEIPGQTRAKFIRTFKDRFLDEWDRHYRGKTRTFTKLGDDIDSLLPWSDGV